VADLSAQIVTGQTKIDSMLTVLKRSKNDTNKVKTINILVLQLVYTGSYQMSDSLAVEELRLSNTLRYKIGVANSYNNMGVIFNYESDYSHSLEYLLKALKIYDTLNYKDGMGISYKYIGAVYNHEGDTTNALEYFHKALHIFYQLKDTNYIASALVSVGNLYEAGGRHDIALAHLRKSFQLFTRINNKDGVGSALMYIGSIYRTEKMYDSAMSYVMCAKQIFEELKDNDGISRSLDQMASIYLADNKFTEALEYSYKSLELAKQIGSLDIAMNAQKTLSEIYEKKNDGANALAHYRLYVAVRDSIYSQQSTLKTLSAQTNYTNEKRDAAEKAENEKKEALHSEEIKRSQTIIYAGSGILLVLIVFSIFIYLANVQRKKDNRIIEQKNYQITQSISYAERIQRAMLPDKSGVYDLLPQSFVLFKPKDVVSGDFYFVARKDEKIILAAADCTGHGVPGGFMSMLCSEKLSDAVYQTQNTGEILKLLNQGVKSSLHQSESEDSTYDGMDIALCVIIPSIDSMKLNYSGALRPLWIIREGADDIEEIKPTPRTIGGFAPVDQDYGTYIIQLHKGDTFYLFTDGYIDQFGGEAGKKLGLKRFKELLLSLRGKTMQEQEIEVTAYIEYWKGTTPQLDDMLVIGVRV
jgi:serine phosphatase RsbU (regulator of sigma subunit)